MGTANFGRQITSGGEVLLREQYQCFQRCTSSTLTTVGHDAHTLLVKLIEETAQEEFLSSSIINSLKLCISRSAYVFDIKFPTAEDIERFGKMHVVDGNKLFMQRISSTHNFYG